MEVIASALDACPGYTIPVEQIEAAPTSGGHDSPTQFLALQVVPIHTLLILLS